MAYSPNDKNPILSGSSPANYSYLQIVPGIPTVVGFGPTGGDYNAANERAELKTVQASLAFLVLLGLNLGRST